MISTRQITAVTILLALVGCSERRMSTGKAPENIPRERYETAPPPKKPDLEAAYDRRQAEELVRGDAVEHAAKTDARIGVAGTHIFHRPDCASLKGVPTADQVRFTSPYDGVDAGYSPCPTCHAMSLH